MNNQDRARIERWNRANTKQHRHGHAKRTRTKAIAAERKRREGYIYWVWLWLDHTFAPAAWRVSAISIDLGESVYLKLEAFPERRDAAAYAEAWALMNNGLLARTVKGEILDRKYITLENQRDEPHGD